MKDIKPKSQVEKSLQNIIAHSKALNERFKKDFETDPAGVIKWCAKEVHVQAIAARQAKDLLDHLQKMDEEKWPAYWEFRKLFALQIMAERTVTEQNPESMRDHEAGQILLRAFTDHLNGL